VNASSHIAEVRFDAKGLVANAGLVLPTTLGERLGLPELLRQHVHLCRPCTTGSPRAGCRTGVSFAGERAARRRGTRNRPARSARGRPGAGLGTSATCAENGSG